MEWDIETPSTKTVITILIPPYGCKKLAFSRWCFLFLLFLFSPPPPPTRPYTYYTSCASPPFQELPISLLHTPASHLHLLHLVHFITFLQVLHLSYPCTRTAPPFLHHHPYISIFTPPFLHLHPYTSFPTPHTYPHSFLEIYTSMGRSLAPNIIL